jgi:hypothetical protein
MQHLQQRWVGDHRPDVRPAPQLHAEHPDRLAPELHVSNRVPGPQVLGSLGDEADRIDGDLAPGQFPPGASITGAAGRAMLL